MIHYSAEDWADFARNVVEGSRKLMMQKHIDTGCTKCTGELQLWRSVATTAKKSNLVEPPAPSVRGAKALMAAQNVYAPASATPTIAKLLFDSMLAPAALGVRSAGTWPRQLLFGFGDHRIDLRMEPKIDAEKVAIIGQVLDTANPEKMFSKIPVSLHLGKKMLACSETNSFGEFELECDLIGRLELRATLGHGQMVSVSLIEPAAQPPAESPYLTDAKHEAEPLRGGKRSTKKKV